MVIFIKKAKKKFDGQNQGLSGLKNIWPVIMTGDLLSIIFGPDYIGEKFVPRTVCLLSEVNRYTAELSFGSSCNTLS